MPYIVYNTTIEVCDRHVEIPIRDVKLEVIENRIEVPVHHHAEKEIEYVYNDVPYEVIKWENREIEVPYERVVINEIVEHVEVPCIETKIEYVDRVIERKIAHEREDNCLTEVQFADLWNRMLTINRNGLRDECLTANKFVSLVEEACSGA